jgi:WhiB family redox-sensing transcriptional regulator
VPRNTRNNRKKIDLDNLQNPAPDGLWHQKFPEILHTLKTYNKGCRCGMCRAAHYLTLGYKTNPFNLGIPEDGWQQQAACSGKTDIFFSVTIKDRNEAKMLCSTCPVEYQCLQNAINDRSLEGILGGLTEDEREKFYRRSIILTKNERLSRAG